MDPLDDTYPHVSPYNYVENNPLLRTDPTGKGWILKTMKIVAKVARNGASKASVAEAFAGNVQDARTVMDSEASTLDRVVAGGSLLSELAPVSVDDVRTVGTALGGAATALGLAKTADNAGDASRTSRAARREAMREAGIPTSQQPKSQSRNESGYEYRYEVPTEGGGTKTMSVQQQTLDRSHDQPHWEAGPVKTDDVGDPRMNNHGRPKLQSGKSKVNYDE